MESVWQEYYQQHLSSADDAVIRGIRSGQYVVFGHAVGAPERIARAMFDQRETFRDVRVFHMIYMAEPWHLRPEMRGHIRPYLSFLDANTRPAYSEGWVDYVPCYFSEVPELFRSGLYPVDVAVVQLSKPNAEGYCSFGLSCDYTKVACECAEVIIAEINERMPFIGGDNLIHVTELDYIVEVDRPLREVRTPEAGVRERTIARYCADLIQDGDTLQIGIGAVPESVLDFLGDRKGLGIHTELLSDGVMHLMQSGQITGEHKVLHPHKVTCTLVMGKQELYEFLDHNPQVEMYPVDYTNDPYVIGQHDRFVAINSCLEVDLMGQVASESLGARQFSGTGGQVDFLRGARRSKGGLSILAFSSTAQGDTISRIVPILKEGAAVTSPRNDVDYIVTEYGCVRLRGKSLRERAEALASIAHPQFRPMLLEAIERQFPRLGE